MKKFAVGVAGFIYVGFEVYMHLPQTHAHPDQSMTKQKVAAPKDHRYKYDCVVTRKMLPDKRFACNRVIGSQRPAKLPQSVSDAPAAEKTIDRTG